MFGKRLLGRVQQAFGLVLGFHQIAAFLVGFGVGLGVLDHLFDVLVGQTARGLNGDRLLFVGALVLGLHRHDAVGVDVKRDLDLRQTARRGRDLFKVELAQHLVVRRHFPFALEDADGHGVLVVFGGGEHLRFLGRDRGVAVDQAGEHATQRFDAQRQRGHVEQHHILDVALQHARLNGGTSGDDFIGVDALVRFLAEELGDFFDHARHAGHTADQHDFVNVANRQAGILQRVLAGLDRLFHQIIDQRFQLGAGQLDDKVQRLAGVLVHRYERLVDFGLRAGGQFDLGLFSGFLQALQGHLVQRQIDAVFLFELIRQIVDDAHVEIFATKEGIAVGGFHFEQAVVDFQNGDVEGAAAKVIDGDGARFLAIQTVGQRGCGRFVDDTQHFQTGDLAGVFGGLTLGVVEIGRNRDHGLGDGFTQIGFSGFLHLLQDDSRHLRGGVFLTAGFDPCVTVAAVDDLVRHVLLVFDDHRIIMPTPDQALDGEDGVGGVGNSLPLCGLPDQTFILGVGDDRRRGARAFRVFDDPGLRAIHDGDARVGRPEVNTNDFGHKWSLSVGDVVERNPLRHSDPIP
ncbi:MAG: hypothetical protein ACD_10C00376G0001 [uncultured bacterium]|nr:MAG: hypothetical protein ACD_10C00376G0001 [uncultured bacterium]